MPQQKSIVVEIPVEIAWKIRDGSIVEKCYAEGVVHRLVIAEVNFVYPKVEDQFEQLAKQEGSEELSSEARDTSDE